MSSDLSPNCLLGTSAYTCTYLGTFAKESSAFLFQMPLFFHWSSFLYWLYFFHSIKCFAYCLLFSFYCFSYFSVCSVVQLLATHGLQPSRLLCPWNFPGKNTGADCPFLLQGIFLSQWINPCFLCFLHWQVESLTLCHFKHIYLL